MRVTYRDITANSYGEYSAIVMGLAKEFHLLKKCVSKGVADEKDEQRLKYITEILDEIGCPGCGQNLTTHEH